jgi:hypothetical protein
MDLHNDNEENDDENEENENEYGENNEDNNENAENEYENADQIWNLFVNTQDENIVIIVRSFFQQNRDMEPFFYYVMSKRVLVDHLPVLIREFLPTLQPRKILTNIIDGWKDFFLRSNYTLGETTRGELESYRILLTDVLNLIVGHLGENHKIHAYYRQILFDYFFIRI